MKYDSLFLLKIGKNIEKLSSAAFGIGALKVKAKQPSLSLLLNKMTTQLRTTLQYTDQTQKRTSSVLFLHARIQRGGGNRGSGPP